MAEFEEKLNALLSNPESMSRIMELAQGLGLGGSTASQGSESSSAAQPTAAQPFAAQASATSPSGALPLGGDILSSLTGGLDPKLLAKLLPLVQELGSQQNSNSRQLIFALRPYLQSERQEKVERALQLARLIHLGKRFLAGWEA